MEKLKKRPPKTSDNNIDNSIKCFCDQKAIKRMSRSENNPGRLFYVCQFSPNGCGYFQWVDQLQLRLETFGIINNVHLSSSLPPPLPPSPPLLPSNSSFNNISSNDTKRRLDTIKRYTLNHNNRRNDHNQNLNNIDNENDDGYSHNNNHNTPEKSISENSTPHYTSFSPLIDDANFWTTPPSSSLSSSHHPFNNYDNSNKGGDNNVDTLKINHKNISKNIGKVSFTSSQLSKIIESHLNKQDRKLRVYKRSIELLRGLVKESEIDDYEDNDNEVGFLKNKIMTLEKRNRELEEKDEVLEEKYHELEEKYEELEEKIKEVEEVNQELEEKMKEVEEKNKSLETNLTNIREQKDNEIEELKEKIKTLDETIKDESELDTLRNEINSLITVNEDIEAELEYLRGHYNSMDINSKEELTEDSETEDLT